MSAEATALADAPAGRDQRPGLLRLTRVELRKMVDTRSGFWLQLSVLGLTVAAVLISALAGHASDHTFRKILSNALEPAAFLLPVIGILSVSSEWSQRTALISFALVPGRARLIAAKALAGVALAIFATAVAVVLAALGTLIASPDVPHAWSLPAGLLGQDLVYVVTAMLTGVGFGAALLASAPAIVLYFGLPVAFAAVGAIHGLNWIHEWLSGEALKPLTEAPLSGHEWIQVVTTLALWMVVPLALGLWRVTRGDVG